MNWTIPFPPLWTGLLLIALSLAVLAQLSALRGMVGRRAQRLVFLLRTVAALLLLTLLLRPYWIQRRPDPERFRIRLLADVSGSMSTRDMQRNASRAEAAWSALDAANPQSWLSRLQRRYQLELSCFADREYPFAPASRELIGRGYSSAIGAALENVLAEQTGTIGAVVLFTDGQNNLGPAPMEFAEQFRSRRIPVNVVGVGGRHALRDDVAIEFTAKKWETEQDQELYVEAAALNRMSQNFTTRARLLAGGRVVAEKELEIPAQGRTSVRFEVPTERQGLDYYRVELVAPEGDSNLANNLDGALVRVNAPKILRVLYLADRLGLQFRFLKAALSNAEQFTFEAIVRTGENRFYTLGEELPEGFPRAADFWFRYQALLIDSQALDALTSPAVEGLKNFVDRRGGGLLVLGNPQFAAEKLGRLLPATEAQEQVARDDRKLEVAADSLFQEAGAAEWELFLPGGFPAFPPRAVNRSARVLAQTAANGEPVLLAQAYGAGRCACWTALHDWVWPLNSADGAVEHQRFWSALTGWLGAGSAKRIQTGGLEQIPLSAEHVALSVELLGADFEPSRNALAEALIYPPQGERKVVQLFPDPQEPGRYQAEYSAQLPGQYAVTYRVEFPGGEILEQDWAFAVQQTSSEFRDVDFEEDLLMNLARATGGSYRHVDELDAADAPRLSPLVPLSEERKYPTDNAWFMLLALGALGAEWIARRQAGLV